MAELPHSYWSAVAQRLDLARLRWTDHGEILFPGELPDQDFDPVLAYNLGRLPAGKATISRIALQQLQAAMKGLFESFLNQHDRGFDGRTPRQDDQIALSELRAPFCSRAADILVHNGIDGLAAFAERARQWSVSDRASLNQGECAAFIAEFYAALPGAISAVGDSRSMVEYELPSSLREAHLLGLPADVREGLNVLRTVASELGWAFEWIVLHGSFATLDYVIGYSDVDTFGVLRRGVASDPSALLAIRASAPNLWSAIRKADPTQHHGLMCCAAEDFDSYPPVLFPLQILQYGKTLLGQEGSAVQVKETVCHELARSVSRRTRQYFRWCAMTDSHLESRFSLKYATSTLMLVPAFYLQQSGRYRYKRDTFEPFRQVVGDDLNTPVERATRFRAAGGAASSARVQLPATSAQIDDLLDQQRALNQEAPEIGATDVLGEDWLERACRLCEAVLGPGTRSQLNRDRDAVSEVAWEDFPVEISLDAYTEYLAQTQRSLEELNEDCRAIRYGGARLVPGLSDVDTLVVVDPRIDDLSQLSTWRRRPPAVAATLAPDGPSMIVPKSMLWQVECLYPVSNLQHVDFMRADPLIDKRQAAGLAVAETMLSYVLRFSLSSWLRGVMPVRAWLSKLNSLCHALKIMEACGYEGQEWSSFTDDVRQLRSRWFELPREQQKVALYSIARKAIEIELSLVDEVRLFLRRMVTSQQSPDREPSRVVRGVWANDTVFVDDWRPLSSLHEMLGAYRRTGRLLVVLPSEILHLLVYYRQRGGFLSQMLATRLATSDPLRPLLVAPAVESRRQLVESHYAFLKSRGVDWGGVPHWSANPVDPAWGNERELRELERQLTGSTQTPREYWQRFAGTEERMAAVEASVDVQDWNLAIQASEQLLDSGFESGRLHYLLAFSRFALANTDPSLVDKHLARALQLGFDAGWVHWVWAQVHSARSETPAAIEHLVDAVRCGRSEAESLLGDHVCMQVRAMMERGQTRLAAARLDEVLPLVGNHAESLYLSAVLVLTNGGDALAARSQLKKAEELGFDAGWCRYYQAQTFVRLNDAPGALICIESCLSVAPDHGGAMTLRSELEHVVQASGLRS